jgi:ketosteroid isomerase-like protein
MISEAMKDKNVYLSAQSTEMIVHTFGPSVAVVTGVARESGKTPKGKTFSNAYRFTDTWVERNGNWQCVAASAIAMPKKKPLQSNDCAAEIVGNCYRHGPAVE